MKDDLKNSNTSKISKKQDEPGQIGEVKNNNIPAKKKKIKKKHFLRNAILLLFMFLIAGGTYAFFDAKQFLTTNAAEHFDTEPRKYVLTIPAGMSFDGVAKAIYAEGGISSTWRFRLLGKYNNVLGSVQAGEFELCTDWTPDQVLHHLVSGKARLFPLTIPEGLPWWKVAELIEENGFAKADDFKAVIHDPDFLAKYGIPFANAEGFILPETYHLLNPKNTPHDRAKAEFLASLMVETFWKKTSNLWETPPPAQILPDIEKKETNTNISPCVPAFVLQNPDEVKRLIILASLVEKESALAEERPRIAGVYSNRLRLGMLLQCDPTILYGLYELGKKSDGIIYRSQLKDPTNRYNTYIHPGLPPGPICSPGLQSMKAAFNPEKNEYLYFVATGQKDGTHTFSRTVSEHNKAVQIYRRNTR